jgi:hypothetical protein
MEANNYFSFHWLNAFLETKFWNRNAETTWSFRLSSPEFRPTIGNNTIKLKKLVEVITGTVIVTVHSQKMQWIWNRPNGYNLVVLVLRTLKNSSSDADTSHLSLKPMAFQTLEETSVFKNFVVCLLHSHNKKTLPERGFGAGYDFNFWQNEC